ncbi:hypothetical protein GFY24_11140 [Nocardia sp. SYP-A9097]|uniref:hypothetical protein n=1 Tax=Nocardia sp. SYP-A9097 TaxID=2663237 RepID=UPI00129BAE5B|nr:hypothetical protein [Nocardia sp. SYP-A9097]MRH87993.1 hypothetical protein [Nocardia sp. SYP-A9097]
MPVVRIHIYRVEPEQMCELLRQRAVLIDEIRSTTAGLTETRLARLEGGSYADTWRWESAEQMLAAFGSSRGWPLRGDTTALTAEIIAHTGEIIDER